MGRQRIRAAHQRLWSGHQRLKCTTAKTNLFSAKSQVVHRIEQDFGGQIETELWFEHRCVSNAVLLQQLFLLAFVWRFSPSASLPNDIRLHTQRGTLARWSVMVDPSRYTFATPL